MGHVPLFATLDVPFVSDFIMNIQQAC